MELEEAQKILKISLEDDKLVKRYLGFLYANINILGNFNMDNYNRLSKEGGGRKLPENTEEFKKSIDDFVNLYSIIYKESKGQKNTKTLYRGTSISNVDDTSHFLSTSTKRDVAERFCAVDVGTLVTFELEDGVPFIDVEKYLEESSANEHEVLIAPFCEVTKSERTISYNGFNNYKVKIKKRELEELESGEKDSLYAELVERFGENMQAIKEGGSLIERLAYRGDENNYSNDYKDYAEMYQKKSYSAAEEYKRALFNKNEKKAKEWKDEIDYYSEKAQSILQEEKDANKRVIDIRKSTNDFSKKLQRLLVGMCKEKELEIDKAIEVTGKHEMITQISSRIANEPTNSEKLESTVNKTYQDLLMMEKRIRNMAESFGIEPPKTISESSANQAIIDIRGNIKGVQEKLQTLDLTQDISFEEAKQLSDNLIPLLDGISYGIEISSDFSQLTDQYRTQVEKDMMKKLYSKAQSIIKTAQIKKYQAQRTEISNKKIGFFGKLFGKAELKEAQLKNLDLKIKLANIKEFPQDRQDFNASEILADIYAFSMTELGGEFTPEMQQLCTAIRTNCADREHGNFPEEYINQLAQKKLMEKEKVGLPDTKPKRFFGRNRAMIDTLQAENDTLQRKINFSDRNRGLNIEQNNMSALDMLEHKLKGIMSISKDDRVHEKTNSLEEHTGNVW